jgi:hypothetical protein
VKLHTPTSKASKARVPAVLASLPFCQPSNASELNTSKKVNFACPRSDLQHVIKF